jgi:uncharacterized repeat protein (TIGR03943 family)
MRKDAQAVLLLLLGGTLLKISFTGTYVRYVKPGLLPLLVIAGVVIVIVALATLWQVIRRPLRILVTGGGAHAKAGTHFKDSVDDDPADVAHDVHEPSGAPDLHGHGEPRVGWLLLLPALALLLFAPPALGSYQASRNGTALSSRAESDFAPLPDGDPVKVSLLEYASRAVFDQGRSLQGRRVMLSGFIIAGPNGQPYLARLVVACCAADARPIKVGLAGDVPPDLKADRWIEVVGTFTDRTDRDPVNEDVIPYLQVAETRDLITPEQPYES